MRTKFERFSPDWWAFMTEPEPNTGCWLWTGSVCARGYGRLAYGNGSPVLVHRIAYECAKGPTGGRHVLHRCDTPSCVNPDHLFVGTQGDNMRDMFAKGRGRPHGRAQGWRETPLTAVGSAPVAQSVARKNLKKSVEVVESLHLTRTNSLTAGWRHVTGVPEPRQISAMSFPLCPLSGTQELSIFAEPVTDWRDTGAEVWESSARSLPLGARV